MESARETKTGWNFFVLLIHLNAFVSGAVIMAFEMLGSRYLNPYFGSGIYTWSALISTVLIALMVGYFVGGWLADRFPTPRVLGAIMVGAALFLSTVPSFAEPAFNLIFESLENVALGAMLAATALIFFPLALLGTYSPFAIRLILNSTLESGRTAGRIYGISTLGSVFGTLFTTFYLIPNHGTLVITYVLTGITAACGLSLLARQFKATLPIAVLAITLSAPTPSGACQGPALSLESARALPEGLLEERESEYHRIFIMKQKDSVLMKFRKKGGFTQSWINLSDPGHLVKYYTRMFTAGVLFTEKRDKALMIGLGGGATSKYLLRHLPNLHIDVVEVDQAIVECAEKYFFVRKNDRFRINIADGRVFLRRHNGDYDFIYVDAFRSGHIPFHLTTREFYQILAKRLRPGGAALLNFYNGNELFLRSLRTLASVFPRIFVFNWDRSSVVVALPDQAPSRQELGERAVALQNKYRFRHDLSKILEHLSDMDKSAYAASPVLTDDFAPANLLQNYEINKK